MLIYRWSNDRLGPNPLQLLTAVTGHSAMIFLILSLTPTPGRRLLAYICRLAGSDYGKRLSDWNALVRLRRMIGLWSFFYAVVHFLLWMEFDIGWELTELTRASAEKSYVVAGMIALLILLLLAVTSTNRAIRLLQRHWKRLHRLVYIAAGAAALHYLWLAKIGQFSLPYIYGAIFFVLLGYRGLSMFGVFVSRAQDDGEEVPERSPG